MKRLIMIISLFLLLIGCKGSTNLPLNYSIEFMGLGKEGMGLIDRKVDKIELDVSQKGMAILIVTMTDEMQINNKRKEFTYTIYLRIQENKLFRIHK
jgi:hypothetical protein